MRALKTGRLLVVAALAAAFFVGCAGTESVDRAGYDIVADQRYSLFAGQELDMSGAAGGGTPVVPLLSPMTGDGVRTTLQYGRGFTVNGPDGTTLEFMRVREAVSGVSGESQTITWQIPEGVLVLARVLDMSGEGYPPIEFTADTIVENGAVKAAVLVGGADDAVVTARFTGMATDAHALGVDPFPIPLPGADSGLPAAVGRAPDPKNDDETAAFSEGIHPVAAEAAVSWGSYAAVACNQMDAPGTYSIALGSAGGRAGKAAEGVTFWVVEAADGGYSVKPVTAGIPVELSPQGEGIVVAIHEAGGIVDAEAFGALTITYAVEVAAFDEGRLREVGAASPVIALEIRGSLPARSVVDPIWLELSGAVSSDDLELSEGVFATPFYYVRGASAASASGAPVESLRRIGMNGAERFSPVPSAGAYPTVDVITLLRVAPVVPGTAASFTIRVFSGATGGSDVVELTDRV